MPIYEYQCTNCHHQFDLMQKISDAPAKQCPCCFESTATRLISAAGFQLKGTGWYVTDFKNKKEPESKKIMRMLIIQRNLRQQKRSQQRLKHQQVVQKVKKIEI